MLAGAAVAFSAVAGMGRHDQAVYLLKLFARGRIKHEQRGDVLAAWSATAQASGTLEAA